jgi:hypothetical protein
MIKKLNYLIIEILIRGVCFETYTVIRLYFCELSGKKRVKKSAKKGRMGIKIKRYYGTIIYYKI